MKILPDQIQRLLTRSENVLQMEKTIADLTGQLEESKQKFEDASKLKEDFYEKIDKLKKEKVLLESVIKKKNYEIDEIELNNFLKLENLKDLYEKKICVLDSENSEELKNVAAQKKE